jgi:hypothetical protein
MKLVTETQLLRVLAQLQAPTLATESLEGANPNRLKKPMSLNFDQAGRVTLCSIFQE